MKELKLLQKLEEIIKQEFKVIQIGGALRLEEQQEKGYPVTVLKKNGAVLAYNFDVKDSNNTVFPIRYKYKTRPLCSSWTQWFEK